MVPLQHQTQGLPSSQAPVEHIQHRAAEKLLSLLLAFGKRPDMKSRASALQMALSDLQAEAVEQKFSDWREFGYRLDEAYDKIPIAEAGRLTADDIRARRNVVYDRIVLFLRYVHVPNSRVNLSEMGYVLGVLVIKKGEKEAT